MSVITFDWAQIAYVLLYSCGLYRSPHNFHFSYIGSPLATPCKLFKAVPQPLFTQNILGWAEANIFAGFVFFFCTFKAISWLLVSIWLDFQGSSLPCCMWVDIFRHKYPFDKLTPNGVHQHMVWGIHAVSPGSILTTNRGFMDFLGSLPERRMTTNPSPIMSLGSLKPIQRLILMNITNTVHYSYRQFQPCIFW